MSKPLQDAAKALSYVGETVLVELAWDDDRETLWRCYHIVGVVLPVPGVYEHGYFLTMPFADSLDFPAEIYFDSIRTLRPMRQRDRAATGNVLGHIAFARAGRALERTARRRRRATGRRPPPCVSLASVSMPTPP